MSKLYVWVNSKISPLQKGIQSAHLVHTLVESQVYDASADPSSREEFVRWVMEGKTIVVLEGGTHNELSALFDLFEGIHEDDHYPYDYFTEGDLNEAMTAVGIVLDEQWDQANRGAFAKSELNDWEQQVLNKLMMSREAA